MKMAFPLIGFFLISVVPLAPSVNASAVTQDPKSAEKTAAAYKTPTRDDRKTQSGANESAAQSNLSEGPNDALKPGSSDTAAGQYYESATNLYAAGKLDEAISAFLQSARLKPDNPQTHYGLGMAYAKSKSYREAADSFKRAVKFKPEWPEANFRVGMMAYVIGNKDEANEAYTKLRRLNSPLANTLYRVIKEDGTTAGVPETVNTEWQSKPAETVPVAASNKEAETNTTTQPEATDSANGAASSQPTANNTASSAPEAEQTLTTTYRVGVGDILDIRLLNSTTPRSTLYTVVDGGLIDLPIAGGPVPVAGLTTEEIQGRIAAELKRRAVEVNSRVSVGIRQYSSHAVIVTGLVATPGTRFLRREAIPLYVIMAEVQPRLDAGRITILRAGVEGRTFDLSDSSALSTLIRPGDVLSVGPRPQEFYYIGGRVNYPGQKNFQSGITLLQALLAAGGPAQNENNVDLSREGADGRLITTRYSLKEIKLGRMQDPKLRSGDRIEVVR
ncbi:MAG TPA: tetratricopeptide repeat protein [Pyrinomonadaceae bacterium]|nr:tetratricopeptide repeat protein [Pyrinomonadaceae bacterium]